MSVLSELTVVVGAQISGFTDAMKTVSEQLGSLGETATASLEHFDGILEGFGEIAAAAGIATGAFEIAKEAIENFSKAQDVQTSFKLLTGSAEEAQAAFEGLKEQAIDLALPFDSLVSVAQKLAPQFGVGTEALKQVTTAAADAAAATGRSFDTIAEGLDRIAITGQVSTRQMVQFGVSMSDIATAMGVSTTQAIALLKKGGQDAQADVDAVVTAIENKFGGAAETIGQNLSGQFTKLKDELAFISEDLGAALAPLAKDLVDGLKDIEPALKEIVADGVVPAVGAIQDLLGWIQKVSGEVSTTFGPEFTALSTQLKDLALNIKAIGDDSGLTAMLQAESDAVRSLGGNINLLKSAFDLLFPQFGQLKDLLTAINYALDLYQGKIMGMTGPTNDLGTSARGLSDAWKDAGMGLAVTQSVYDKAKGYFGDTKSAVDSLALAFADLGVKVPPSEAELNKLATALETIKAAYDAGKIPLSEYDAAVTDFTKKMNSLQGAFVAASLPVDQLGQALKAAGLKDEAQSIDALQRAVATAADGFAAGRISLSAYSDEIDKANAAYAKLNPQTAEWDDIAKHLYDQLPNYTNAFNELNNSWRDSVWLDDASSARMNKTASDLTSNLAKMYSQLTNSTDAMKSIGLQSEDSLQGIVTHAKQVYDALVEMGAPIEDIARAFTHLQTAEVNASGAHLDAQALGIPNLQDLEVKLDSATGAYERLNSDGSVPTREKLLALQAVTQDQIAVQEMLGENTDGLKQKLITICDQLRTTQGFWLSLDQTLHSLSTTLTNDIGQGIGKLAFSLFDNSANDKLDQQMQTLRDALSTTASTYATTVAGLKTQMGDLETASADSLQKTLDGLTANIDAKNLQYQRDTQNLTTSYQQQTQSLNDSIASNDLSYQHWVEQQQLRLKQLEGDTSTSANNERQDIQLSLTQRAEDQTLYLQQAKEKQDAADAAYKLSTQRQADDYAASVATIKQQQVDATTAAKAQLDTQEANVQKQLDTATAAFDKYKTDNAAQLLALQTQHQSALDKIGTMFADVFTKAGESLVTFVTEFLVGKLFKQLDLLTDTMLPNVGKAISSAFSSNIPGLGGNISTPPFAGGGIPGVYTPGIGDIPTIGADGSTAAGGSVASVAGQAAGMAVSSVVGMVTGAISAVTGIIDVFQNMHQETSLNAIESNTRVGALYTLAAVQNLQGIQDYLYKGLHPMLLGILQATTALAGMPAQIAAALTPKGPDYSEYTADTLGTLHADLLDLKQILWGQIHDDMVSIETKLDILNQSVQGGGFGASGSVVIDGIRHTVSDGGGNPPSTPAAPTTTQVMFQGISGRDFLDALFQVHIDINAGFLSTIQGFGSGLVQLLTTLSSQSITIISAHIDNVVAQVAQIPPAINVAAGQIVQSLATMANKTPPVMNFYITEANDANATAAAIGQMIRTQGAFA